MASVNKNGTSSPEAPKNKRQELSFAERIKVIHARESGKSMRQLAAQFGCGKTQILNIISQKDSLLKEWEEKHGVSNPYISSRKRRSRITGNEEINTKVWEWYTAQKSSGIHVTGSMMQQEALCIARALGISNFAASNGWLDSFRRLHNIGRQSRNTGEEEQSNVSASPNGLSSEAESDPLLTFQEVSLLDDDLVFDNLLGEHSDVSSSSNDLDLSAIQPSSF